MIALLLAACHFYRRVFGCWLVRHRRVFGTQYFEPAGVSFSDVGVPFGPVTRRFLLSNQLNKTDRARGKSLRGPRISLRRAKDQATSTQGPSVIAAASHA